jgi:phenylacetate-CoA ligase
LIFFLGKERISHDVAAKWRATRWWGVDIGDAEIVIWGSPIELHAQDRLRRLRDRVLRTRLLSAFEMSPQGLDQMISVIRSARPRMLFGYPSALAHIARHADRIGARLDDLEVEVAFVTSESLYEHQRAQIEHTFACRVANGYGGRDAGFVAHECPAGSLHVTAEDVIVEIISPQGAALPPGERGEIVVTHLASKDFPFIRYRTGDIGALSDQPCACGRGLPVLGAIEGRATDFVVAQDGRVVHGLAMIYVLREITGIAEFRIVQESLQTTVVDVVPCEGFDADCKHKIAAGIKARLGAQTEVRVEVVDEIPRERSGKFRFVQSNVASHAT